MRYLALQTVVVVLLYAMLIFLCPADLFLLNGDLTVADLFLLLVKAGHHQRGIGATRISAAETVACFPAMLKEEDRDWPLHQSITLFGIDSQRRLLPQINER